MLIGSKWSTVIIGFSGSKDDFSFYVIPGKLGFKKS
jgi:hypothetical protein